MELGSLVEIVAEGFGTGYSVATSLVLTARHVVSGCTEVKVRALGTSEWVLGDVVWQSSEENDAALIRISVPPVTGHHFSPRWAKVESREPQLCRVTGFPYVAKDENGRRDTDTMSGIIVPGASNKAGRLVVASSTGGPIPGQFPRKSPWAGISGSPVFMSPGQQLVGIISTADSNYESRLEAVPVAALLADPSFSDLVGRPTLEIITDENRVFRPPYIQLPPRRPDSWLLEPRFAVVNFTGRDKELDTLRAWASDEQPISLAIVWGAGGLGKTRLGSEFARSLMMAGWDAGFLRMEDPIRFSWDDFSNRPTLLVVDYPSRYVSKLNDLIRFASERPTSSKVRILLLERSLGSWWDDLNHLSKSMAVELLDLSLPLDSSEHQVNHLGVHLDVALESFADLLDKPKIDSTEVEIEELRTILEVHIAALLAYRQREGGGHFGRSRKSVFDTLLAREKERWESYLPKHKLEGLHAAIAQQLVALVSLTRPQITDLAAVIQTVPSLQDRGEREKISFWLEDMFASPSGVLEPIGPDLLVAKLLEGTANLSSLIEGINSATELGDRYRSRMFYLLGLASETEREVQAAINAFMTSNLVHMVQQAINDPDDSELRHSIRSALTACTPSRAIAQQAEIARIAIDDDRNNKFSMILESLSSLIVFGIKEGINGNLDELDGSPSTHPLGLQYHKLSVAILNNGRYLGFVSQWPKAFAANLEGARISHALFAAFGSEDDLANLGIAFSHAGECLSNLSMYTDAIQVGQAAVNVWRNLARQSRYYSADLSISLRKLGRTICSSGRAAQAVRVARESVTVAKAAVELARKGSPTDYRRAQKILMDAFSDLAHHLLEINNLRDAADCLRKSDDIESELGLRPRKLDGSLASSNNYIHTQIALRQGRFDEAVEYAMAAVELSASSYAENAGLLYAFRGALKLLLEALTGAGRITDAEDLRKTWAEWLVEPDLEKYRTSHGEIRREDVQAILECAPVKR